jgi:hypothetical protein
MISQMNPPTSRMILWIGYDIARWVRDAGQVRGDWEGSSLKHKAPLDEYWMIQI